MMFKFQTHLMHSIFKFLQYTGGTFDWSILQNIKNVVNLK